MVTDDPYFSAMRQYKEANVKAYQYALLEIGQKCERAEDVPVEQRQRILTIMNTRIPLRDGGYQGKSNYANESNIFFKQSPFSKGYGIEKADYGYERT